MQGRWAHTPNAGHVQPAAVPRSSAHWDTALTFLPLIARPLINPTTNLQGTRDENWMRTSRVWKLFQRRMNLKLVYTHKLDASHQYIIGLHPHGILPWGGAINLVTDLSGG